MQHMYKMYIMLFFNLNFLISVGLLVRPAQNVKRTQIFVITFFSLSQLKMNYKAKFSKSFFACSPLLLILPGFINELSTLRNLKY